MRKAILLSSSQALLISFALSHLAFHCSEQLADADKNIASRLLDELDMCDQIRKRINHAFDLSMVETERSMDGKRTNEHRCK